MTNKLTWEVIAAFKGYGPRHSAGVRSALYRAVSAEAAAAQYEVDWPTLYVVEVKPSEQTGGRYGLLGLDD